MTLHSCAGLAYPGAVAARMAVGSSRGFGHDYGSCDALASDAAISPVAVVIERRSPARRNTVSRAIRG